MTPFNESRDQFNARQLRYLWKQLKEDQAELLNVSYWPEDERKAEHIACLQQAIERWSNHIMAIHMVG